MQINFNGLNILLKRNSYASISLDEHLIMTTHNFDLTYSK